MTTIWSERKYYLKIFLYSLIIAVFWTIFTIHTSYAELKLESVYPNQGVMGQDIDVIIRGSGFDENTRVSMILDAGNRIKIVGNIENIGQVNDIKIVEKKAFVAAGLWGLQIIDFQKPENPKVIGYKYTPGFAYGISIIDDKAFIADGDGGLQVIDISNPANPKIISSMETSIYVVDVKVLGEKIILNDNKVVDISIPENPKIIGTLDGTNNSYGFKIYENMIYVESGTIIENTAYIIKDGKIQIVDISNLEKPKIIGSVNTPGDSKKIEVVGNTVYVADSYSGLQVIDISNPEKPKIIGSVNTPGEANSIAVKGNYAYVADGDGGLQVIDISNPSNLYFLDSLNLPGSPESVIIVDQTAYVTDIEGVGSGLHLIDINDINNPQIISSVNTPGNARNVAVKGNTAYVADGYKGLQIIDLSNPSNPVIVGSVVTPCNALGVVVSGDKAFVSDTNCGLEVIDISNPESPEIVGSVDTPDLALKLAVEGNTVYLADSSSGLQVIDISNPEKPKIIGSVDTPGLALDVAVGGNLAYVVDFHEGLQVIDISNPANPQLIVSLSTQGFARSVKAIGDKIYIAVSESGIQIIDINDAENPTIIGTVDTEGVAYDVEVVGDKAYVADFSGAIIIVPLPNEVKPVTVNSPTEISISFPIPTISGNYTLRVFNKELFSEIIGAFNLSTLDLDSLEPQNLLIQTQEGTSAPESMDQDEKHTLQLIYKAGDGTPFNLSNLPDQVTVQWLTSNPNILSVNSLGIVTAKTSGEATITAKITGGSASVTIQVKGTASGKDYGNLIIVSGRNSENEELESTFKGLAYMVYKRFYDRDFEHEDIYYISSYGSQYLSGQQTDIVDEALTLTDTDGGSKVAQAITGWAAEQSNSGPLYLYLVDHGAVQQLKITPSSTLSASALDAALDQFQQPINRDVVVIVEACKSGTWIDGITGENRLIITSTNDANENLSKSNILNTFSSLLFNDLSKGETFQESFNTAKESIKTVQGSKKQEPQSYVGDEQLWAGYLVGDFATSAFIAVFKTYTGQAEALQVESGSTLNLETTLDVLNESGIEVFALITPPVPGETETGDDFETPVLDQIKVDLAYQGETEDEGYFGGDKIFSGQSSALNESGTYELTFYMKDTVGEITSTSPVTFQVGESLPSLSLGSGWNLLSLNLTPDDSSVDVVLSGIIDDIVSVWKWESGNWAVYLPSMTFSQYMEYVNSKSFGFLTNIDPGEGFWINSNTSQTLTVLGGEPSNTASSLVPGWNLIGLKSSQAKSITDLIGENSAKIASVWKWLDGTWAVYLPGQDTASYATGKGFTVLEDINSGEGFWVNCTEAVTLE